MHFTRLACAATFFTVLFVLLSPARACAQTVATPPAEAHAAPSAAYATPPAEEHEVWYGYETVLVDAASLAAGVGIGLSNPAAGGALFAGGYTLGGPVVHFAHGRPLTGLASLGLRVGAPVVCALVGGFIGAAAESGQPYGDSDLSPSAAGAIFGGLAGAAVGGVVAMTIDATVLARTTTTDAPGATPLSASAGRRG